jgi:hypothetical protein
MKHQQIRSTFIALHVNDEWGETYIFVEMGEGYGRRFL